MVEKAPTESYSRAEIRRLLGVSQQQLRSWQRQGLIPSSESFSFSDLIALRTLQKLRENRIPSRQIGRALVSLKKKLAGVERPLSELRILSDGKTIAVQIAGQRMEAISGQLLFDFETAAIADVKSFPAAVQTSKRRSDQEAEAWFEKGLALEEQDAPLDQAIAAYEKALERNPFAAGALVNLGTIYYRLQSFSQAESYYTRAVDADPKYPLAHFNLGNLYDEVGELEKAQQYYTTALRLNSGYADAHFNLALLCEKTGDFMKAVHHWKAYLKLDSSSSWAVIARRQLERLRKATVIRPRS